MHVCDEFDQVPSVERPFTHQLNQLPLPNILKYALMNRIQNYIVRKFVTLIEGKIRKKLLTEIRVWANFVEDSLQPFFPFLAFDYKSTLSVFLSVCFHLGCTRPLHCQPPLCIKYIWYEDDCSILEECMYRSALAFLAADNPELRVTFCAFGPRVEETIFRSTFCRWIVFKPPKEHYWWGKGLWKRRSLSAFLSAVSKCWFNWPRVDFWQRVC